MPHRHYQPELPKGEKVGELEFGPYKFRIYNKNTNFRVTFSKHFFDYTLYDENNHIIFPPLLRSSITITYTEFRDLLCYLNLPVFSSTRNKSMLFFPNYDLHQRLLEIQGLPRNYSTYTGRNIDWKWFTPLKI